MPDDDRGFRFAEDELAVLSDLILDPLMAGRPIEEKIRVSIRPFLKIAKESFSKNHYLVGLSLCYNVIDVLSCLSGRGTEGDNFMRWARDYVIKPAKLGCNERELYIARCGLTHQLSPGQPKGRRSKERMVCYGPDEKRTEVVNRLTEMVGRGNKFIFISVEDLLKAVESGVEIFISRLATDSEMKSRVEERAKSLYAFIPSSRLL